MLGHLFDVEIVYGFRWRLVLTASPPGYDEKEWSRLPKLEDREVFETWRQLRRANLHLLTTCSREHWRRTGVHAEQGSEDVEIMVRKLAGHDIAHLDQISRALAATGGR